VQALPVDDEPEPFWSGTDASALIDEWRKAVGWTQGWGHFGAPSRSLNGPSGAWVDVKVLAALNATRADAWITDCPDTYRASTGGAAALSTVYVPFASQVGIARADVAPDPSEAQIVAESTSSHLRRLASELEACRPDIVITLGNAALRVMRQFIREPTELTKLVPGNNYAHDSIQVGERTCRWLPLVHPAAPKSYQSFTSAGTGRRRRADRRHELAAQDLSPNPGRRGRPSPTPGSRQTDTWAFDANRGLLHGRLTSHLWSIAPQKDHGSDAGESGR
jgi:uracil-DNA glycosylase